MAEDHQRLQDSPAPGRPGDQHLQVGRSGDHHLPPKWPHEMGPDAQVSHAGSIDGKVAPSSIGIASDISMLQTTQARSARAGRTTACARVYQQFNSGTRREHFRELRNNQGALQRTFQGAVTAARSVSPNRQDPVTSEQASSSLVLTTYKFCNWSVLLGSLLAGLLGGFGTVFVLQAYLLRSSTWRDMLPQLLAFYAPIALQMHRIFYAVATCAFGSAVTRYALANARNSMAMH